MISQAVVDHPLERDGREHAATDELVLAITRMRDPLGVVSLYVDADPAHANGARPGWHIAAENALRSLRARIDSERPADRARLLRSRLAQFDTAINVWLYSRAAGRGRALFIPLSGDEPITVGLQIHLPDAVALDQTAHVAPLLAALDAGRPTGVAVVSRARVRVLELRFGSSDELFALEFDEVTSQWGEIRGGGLANTAVPQPTGASRDRHRHRMDERRARFLDAAGDRLAEVAAERGWKIAAIAGDPRLTAAVARPLDATGRIETATVEQSMDWYSAGQIADAVAGALERGRSERRLGLASRAIDTARAGGPATLGLGETLYSLNDGRVECLIIDMAGDRFGRRLADGRLAVAGEALPGADGEGHAEEEHLTERMVERALETGATVTPVEGPAAVLLAPHDGVAARLRW